MCVSEQSIHGWKLSELKLVNSLSLTHTHTHTRTHKCTHTIPGFHAKQNWEAETSFKLLGSCPLYIKGHYSPRLHSHHISTITLLGTAPGHTKQPIAHNGIIVSGDCSHCRPCYRIYSPPPILWPSPLTPAAISHALRLRACEALCLLRLKWSLTMTQAC